MSTVRRLYFFAAAFIALNVAAVGAVNLLSTLVRPLVEPPAVLGDTRFLRDQIAFGISQIVVALPIWLIHWVAIQRSAAQQPEETRSLLRVFSLYLVLAVAALVGLFQGVFLLRGLLAYPLDLSSPANLLAIIRALGWLGIYGAIWAYHYPIATRVDLTPGGRTIWRWYVYVLSAFGLGMFAWGLGNLLHNEIDYLITQGQTLLAGSARSAFAHHLVTDIPKVIVGGLWWLYFWRRSAAADRGSTLRHVYVFLALAAGLVGTLIGLSWILYEVLRFLFGYRAESWMEQVRFLSSAVPFLILGGATWLYHHDVLEEEAPGERALGAPAGRVYFYLVAAVGLLLAAVGLGNILHILLEFAFQVFQEIGPSGAWWRDQLSRALVETLIGLPLWWVHWALMQNMAEAHPQERQTLPRRIYLYGVLLIGVLAVLVFLGIALNDILRLVLGETVTRRVLTDIFSALGYAVIAGVLVGYHWQVVRTDQAAVGPSEARPVRKRVLVLLSPQQRALVPDLEAALGGPVEVLEQVARDGETATPLAPPSPEDIAGLAQNIRETPSDRVLVLFRPGGVEVYPFK